MNKVTTFASLHTGAIFRLQFASCPLQKTNGQNAQDSRGNKYAFGKWEKVVTGWYIEQEWKDNERT